MCFIDGITIFLLKKLSLDAAQAVKVRRVEKLEDMLAQCDVITVNCPLHEGTRGLINEQTLKHVKKGAWIINTARGAICDRLAIKKALESGHINGKNPPPQDLCPIC